MLSHLSFTLMRNVGLELSDHCSFIHTFTTQRGAQVLNCSYSQTFTSQYCKSIKVMLYNIILTSLLWLAQRSNS